jgi:hypothetical protein
LVHKARECVVSSVDAETNLVFEVVVEEGFVIRGRPYRWRLRELGARILNATEGHADEASAPAEAAAFRVAAAGAPTLDAGARDG